MNDINQNDYLALVERIRNPMPNYVDVNNMDCQDYATTITTIINIFVTRHAGLTPKDHFFSIVVNRLSEDAHVTKEAAICLLSTRMMNGNMQHRMAFQVPPPPAQYNYPPNLRQQQIPNFNYGIQPPLMYMNQPMQLAQPPGLQAPPSSWRT